MESLLTSEDSGKDLTSVQNLMKKHQLVEADIHAHEDRINGNFFPFLSLYNFYSLSLSNTKSVNLPLAE